MKTVKEIASQAGVSKAAIYALIKAHKISVTKVNGLTYVEDKGINSIMRHYGIDYSSSHENIDNHVENSKIIELLEKQLDEKQKVIEELLKALENSQKLQAVPLIADKQINQQVESEGGKLNLFKRIFKRG